MESETISLFFLAGRVLNLNRMEMNWIADSLRRPQKWKLLMNNGVTFSDFINRWLHSPRVDSGDPQRNVERNCKQIWKYVNLFNVELEVKSVE